MPSLVVALEHLENINTVTGLILSLILLYSIRHFSGAYFGTYKNLLTIFALVDTFLVILHPLVHPRTVLVGTTHGVSSDTVFDDRRITAFYIAFQSVPFMLIVIHFLYRFMAVRSPHLIILFSKKFFMLILSTAATGCCMTWYFLCLYGTTELDSTNGRAKLMEECLRMYNRRIENGWIVLDHWHDNQFDAKLFVTVLLTDVLMVTSIALAASLAILAFNYFKRSTKLSNYSIKLQRKLLIALCAQASVPLAFVHIPSLLAINLPIFRLTGGGLHDLVSPIYTCFPVWDAAVIIILLPDYRRGLLRLLKRDKVQILPSDIN